MKEIEKLLDFAEQIAMEDTCKMRKLRAWEGYISPLFKEYTGQSFDIWLVNLYKKEWQKWLAVKRKEFEKDYKA